MDKDKHWGFDDKEVDKKQEIKSISQLINSLVIHVTLSKSAEKYDDSFPGLPDIRDELQAAKDKAIDTMKDLLSRWGTLTG